MATLTFDTLKFVERLTAAGVPLAQAKAEAEALAEALQSSALDLATKQDLRELEARLSGEFKASIANAKADIIKWLAGLLIAQAAVIAALVKLL